ncbi:MAG: RagB/SusD family nutrient uptake outer membrane protein [Bacteroidota bacterium]
MSSISRTRNPLIHSGTSQVERLLQSLTPSAFKIDDRSIKDLLHATYQYAACLHYYDENNQQKGNWQCFWKVEMLTFLAHLSTIDVNAIVLGYEAIKEEHHELDISNLAPEERQAKNNEYLLALIDYLRNLALRIEEMVVYLPDALPMKQEIIALIEKDTLTDTEQLASELAQLVKFHKEAYKQVNNTRLPASEYEAFFKSYWGIPDRLFFDIELDADSSYQSNEQENLDQLLKKFEQTFRKIKMRANYWFDLNIDTPQLRQPHVALFLTFLRLFDHARNSLNNLTKKHLEFYYEKILCLDTRAAVPDDAHLILELAATVDQHLIEKGTQFVAGKDKDGKPLLFQTLENWFLNKAQVKNIKTTYLDVCGVFRDENGNQTKKIYATDDVKIAYKEGTEQPNESKDCWRSMGDDADLPDGEIGFAIASPQLILREGVRNIKVNIQTQYLDLRSILDAFCLSVSTKEGFVEVCKADNLNPDVNNASFAPSLGKIKIKLAQLEAARRMVADFTTDVGMYVPDIADHPDVLAIHQLVQDEIPFLSKNIFYHAYTIIHLINQELLLTQVEEHVGEFKFYRAYCYWCLAKTYAPPFSNNNIDTNLPKLNAAGQVIGTFTIAELYEDIVTNLKEAVDIVSTEVDRTSVHRYTVLSFLGRVLMQMKDWSAAKSIFDEIVDSGLYSLETNITDVFSNKFSEEVVWQYSFDKIKDEKEVANFSIYNWWEEPQTISSRRAFAVSENVFVLYEDGDARLELFELDNTANGLNWSNKYYCHSDSEIVMFRYAEILLNLALCNLQLGDDANATELVNQIKVRSGLNAASVISLNDLLEERVRELAFEGDRKDILQLTEIEIFAQGLGRDLNWDNELLYFDPPELAEGTDFNNLLTEEAVCSELCFQTNLKPDFLPVERLGEGATMSDASEWPILKVCLDAQYPDLTGAYATLRTIKVRQIDIKVAVKGIKENLITQNDQGVFTGIQKFYPFGATPEIGDHFYIGSTEVFQKKIDQLELNFDWIDPPNFFNHYRNYNLDTPNPLVNFSFLEDAFLPTKVTENQFNRSNSIFIFYLQGVGITGIVTDDNNTPLAGVEVRLENLSTTSDQAGRYALDTNLIVDSEGNGISFTKENYLLVASEQFPPITQESPVVSLNVTLSRQISESLVEFGRIRPSIELNNIFDSRDTREQDFEAYRPQLNRGFLRATLIEEDFLHKEYQNVLIRSTISLANENPEDDLSLPNLPYTPATNGITLDYTSSQIITGEENRGIDNYFHLYALKGYKNVLLPAKTSDFCLFPQYKQPTFEPSQNELANGNLYIGLENLTPGSNLSLLIQIKEGSEQNPDVEVPEVVWSYLVKDNEWKLLSQSKILTDTTNGLKKTGIFRLTTPNEMSNETTLFEGNCHWLRASVVEQLSKKDENGNLEMDENGKPIKISSQFAIGLPSIIDIKAQAVQVQFLDQDNELSHLAQPLPDSTIQQLLISQSQVKSIEQPFPSFNGRLAEEGDAFYVRVSERLRHRDRAVNIYDYERLLLERFPKIQRAKCLNHTKPGSLNILEDPNTQLIDTELAPGYVTVAVIPKFSERKGEAATEPRFSRGDLVDMEGYLRSKANLFVAGKDRFNEHYLRVVNPIYEEVQLVFKVQFKTGEAPESRRFELDLALKGFLSPWLFDKAYDIPFGKGLNRSNIIHFIENQSYVDAIADFEMIHCGEEVSGNEIAPTTSRSILTSVIDEDIDPDSTDHAIDVVDNICN